MNRLYAVESTPTLTGARADHRRPLSPRGPRGLRDVASRPVVGRRIRARGAPADPFAAAVAADLKAHAGASLVVAGDEQPAVGPRPRPRHERRARQHGQDRPLRRAAGRSGRRPDGGASASLPARWRTAGRDARDRRAATPSSTRPRTSSSRRRCEKVELRIRLALYDDETSRLCHWHVAEAHALESWSDARAVDGTATILQPLIAPLFGGKTAHELLAAFSGEPEKSRHDIVRDYWKAKLPARTSRPPGGRLCTTAWSKAPRSRASR